jgi:hypothetical protein
MVKFHPKKAMGFVTLSQTSEQTLIAMEGVAIWAAFTAVKHHLIKVKIVLLLDDRCSVPSQFTAYVFHTISCK